MTGVVVGIDPGLVSNPNEVFDFDVGPVTPASAVKDPPGRGMFFDEYAIIRDPEGAELRQRVLAAHGNVRPRLRARNARAEASHIERVSRVLANAMQAHFYRTLPSVLYFRKADAEQYRDGPSWMRHGALGRVIDAFADVGLVRTVTGKKMPYGSATPSSASSYAPTEKLIEWALDCGISAQSIGRHIPTDALVRLFSPKPRIEFDLLKGQLLRPSRGERITFDPTAETEEWTASLGAINAFYRQQAISLALTPEEMDSWLVERNAEPTRRGTPYRLADTFKTDLYRVFNNGNPDNPRFDWGGRLSGGWWMHVPEVLREAIVINRQATTELDFKNCHPRMLYAERGLEYDGDLYQLPEITVCEDRMGVAVGTYRPIVKWLMQVLINGRRRPSDSEKPLDLALPPGFAVKDLVAMVEKRHQPIADTFKTGAGLRLMRLESDIALEIITTAMADDWVALSVHDSFIASIDRADQLRAIMIEAYVRRFGVPPVIKGQLEGKLKITN